MIENSSTEQSNAPCHVAIIMDGNGRWAKQRNLPRTMGHRAGVDAVKRTVEAAVDIGIQYLTLFGFSSENWKRPAEEVGELMRLLRMYLRSETADLHRSNIKLQVIGNREQLAEDIVKLIENAESLTKDNTGITVQIALNYGGRHDILQAASRWAQKCRDEGVEPDFQNAEEYFSAFLSTGDIPDPDILIRTSGEKRISNFLLWQCAYTEFFFSSTLWPDFSKKDLLMAVDDFQGRERRFGALSSQSGG